MRRSRQCWRRGKQGKRIVRDAAVCPRLTPASAGGLLYRFVFMSSRREVIEVMMWRCDDPRCVCVCSP